MLKNLKVGETIRICAKVEDFCGEDTSFLYLLSADIEDLSTQCTISCARPACAYGCIDTTNRDVIFKSVMNYTSSSNDVRCENTKFDKQYKQLGKVVSDAKGISTLTYKITEQDKLDYQDAISKGKTYDIVCCIDEPQASNRNAIAFKGITIGEAEYTDTIKVNIRPWGWYTPQGAADQIVLKMAELGGKLTDYFTPATGYEYIKTDIIVEGSDVTVNIRLKKTGVLSMQLGILESIFVIVILILAGIGLMYLIRWLFDSETKETTSQPPDSEAARVDDFLKQKIKECFDKVPSTPTCTDVAMLGSCLDDITKGVLGTVIAIHTNSADLKATYDKYYNIYSNMAKECNPSNPQATIDRMKSVSNENQTEVKKAYDILVQSMECWIPNPVNGCLVSRQAASNAATVGIIIVGAFLLFALARK